MTRAWLLGFGFIATVGCASSTPTKTGDATESTESTASAAATTTDIKTEEVTYEGGGVTMKGFLAYDASKTGPRPGVLVVHEWWGHNDYARKRATMLAELGYTALAVDMYGDGKQAGHPGDAQKFMMEVFSNMEGAKARFQAAQDLLEAHETTIKGQTAAIGYCFGGAVVLNMARAGSPLMGVASFHGNLSTQTPAQSGDIKAKLLVLHGADDPFVPAEQVDAFKEEMTAAGADLEFIAYPGAKHAFTNPAATENGVKFELPLAYNAEADKASWMKLESFLKALF